MIIIPTLIDDILIGDAGALLSLIMTLLSPVNVEAVYRGDDDVLVLLSGSNDVCPVS